MAESRGEVELYNEWFRIADADRDGVLTGAEAVSFFQRSGLPQQTLFKIWQYVAGDRPSLTRQEFFSAMKLVSLAQLSQGALDDAQAMRLVNGLAGPIRPPALQGLAIPKGIDLPAAPRGPAGPAGPVPAPPGAAGLPPPPVALPPQRAAPYPPPGAPAAPVGAMAGGAGPLFPPLSPEQANAFQTAFTQLDTDRDGWVQGVDCFGVFMQSGLPKEVLKAVWDLVAGDAGQLSRHQFVQALYLIDCVKRNIPLPPALPPGQFPPVAGTVNISQMMGTPQDIYTGLAVPPLMPRAVYQPAGAPPPAAFPSQVPSFDAGQLAALDPTEKMRLESEREAALKQEAERRKAEEERAAAQAKRDFFTAALTELRLAQSNVTRAVVEAQQRCEMEKAEAERMEADYSAAYAEFSVKHAQNAPLVEALKRVQEEKAGLAQKLESLRAVVAQLESVDPEWEHREKGECEALNVEIAGLTVRKEELQRVADAVERQRGELAAHAEALRAAAAGVEEQMAPLKEQVDKLASEASKEGDAVVALLKRLAPLYNTLYDAAKKAMVPLPTEALASIKREGAPFKYDDLLVAGAEAWGDFKDEGYKIVSALPVDTRLTTFTSPALAAAAAEGSSANDLAGAEEEAGADPVAPIAPAPGAPVEGGSPGAPAADAPAAAGAVEAASGSAKGSPAGLKSAGGSLAAEATADAQAPAEASGLLKRASTAAEEEAVQAAAEAGVLASAIAEALAGSRPGSMAGSHAPSKQGSTVAEQALQADAAEQPAFAVTFEASEAGVAAPAEAVPAAPVDAFAAGKRQAPGFGSLSLADPPAGEDGAAAALPESKPAEPAAPAAPAVEAAPEVAAAAAEAMAIKAPGEVVVPAQEEKPQAAEAAAAPTKAGEWAAF